jgi:uncharacterized protein YdaU (DUF1376 family)
MARLATEKAIRYRPAVFFRNVSPYNVRALMHYYNFNIADYRKDTNHLSTLEHGIYRQLLDWYYLDETPIPKETQTLIRRLSLYSENDLISLKNVLSDFFELRDDGYHQARCDKEIAEYQRNADKNRANGKLGGRPKKTQWVILGNPNETQIEPNQKATNNHKPITINQEPITNNQKPDKTISSDCANRFDEFWQKYPKKVGKEAARKSFLKMVKNQTVFDEVIKSLEWQTKSDQWLKDGGQFIPNPATYLNQGRWQDEPDGKSTNSNDFGCLL